MKKLITTFLAIIVAYASIAQSGFEILPPDVDNHPVIDEAQFRDVHSRFKRSTVSGWYNYYESGRDFMSFQLITNNSLFPDSTVMQLYGDGQGGTILGYTGLHAAGSVLDLKSPVFGTDFTRYTSYSLDSISFPYHYAHNIPGTVDTLIVQIFNDFLITKGNLSSGGIYASVPYNKTTNKANNPTHEIQVLLTEADSFYRPNWGEFRTITLAVPNGPMSVPANGLVAFTVTFKPGYAYNPNDTLQHDWNPEPVNKLNHFKILKYREAAKTEEGYSMSLTANRNSKYTSETWNNRFIPGSAWTTFHEHFMSFFHVTANNVSVKAVTNETSLSVYPNPVSPSSHVNVSFKLQNNEKVNIELYNILGQKITTIHDGEFSSGKHQISFNTSTLQGGLYLLRFNAGTHAQTMKLQIQ